MSKLFLENLAVFTEDICLVLVPSAQTGKKGNVLLAGLKYSLQKRQKTRINQTRTNISIASVTLDIVDLSL